MKLQAYQCDQCGTRGEGSATELPSERIDVGRESFAWSGDVDGKTFCAACSGADKARAQARSDALVMVTDAEAQAVGFKSADDLREKFAAELDAQIAAAAEVEALIAKG